jgi:transcriptional regulator with XRE-family HTH domain
MDSPDDTAADLTDDRDELGREFGNRVRGLRESAKLTLEELSRQSGVSRAMLSKVERGEKSPTIGVATRISRARNTSLTFLTGGEEQRRAVALVRKTERHVFRDVETGFERHLLSPPIAGSAVEVLYHYLPPGVSTGMLPPYPAGTEKHVVVVEGNLVVAMDGSDARLTKGDALFFEAEIEHSFENRTKKPCGYYLIVSRRNK